MKTSVILTLAAFATSGMAFTNPASAMIDANTVLQGAAAAPLAATTIEPGTQIARRGGDDRGRDDRGGRGRGRDDRDDDRGGSRSNSNDDNGSGSGRSRPRVPGGSGCDDAGDIAEHSACSL